MTYDVHLLAAGDTKRERYAIISPAGLVVAAYWTAAHPHADTAASREANWLNARAGRAQHRHPKL